MGIWDVSQVHHADDGTWYGYSLDHQRKSFYAGGYYFTFCSSVEDDNDFVYLSSHDKTTWTKPATGNPVKSGVIDSEGVDVYFDGTYVYVVYAFKSNWFENDIIIKKGTISNGTITWGSEYTVYDGVGSSEWVTIPSMTQTSDGYFWVVYSRKISAVWSIFCSKSSNPNDITSWASPVTIVAASNPSQVLPLTSSKVIVIRPKSNGIDAYGFDGTTVDSVEQVTTQSIRLVGGVRRFCGVRTVDGKIHVVYIDTGGDMGYSVRNGTWSDTPNTFIGNFAGASIGRDTNDLWMIYRTYGDNFSVYVRRYNGSWQDADTIGTNLRDEDDYPWLGAAEKCNPMVFFTYFTEYDDGTPIWLGYVNAVIEAYSGGGGGGEIYNPNTGIPIAFPHILEWEEVVRKPIPEKPVYGRDIPTPEAESYQVLSTVIVISTRMNTSEKESLWDLYNEHIWLELWDDSSKIDDVWMEEPRINWDSSLGCGDRPWICTVTLICKTT